MTTPKTERPQPASPLPWRVGYVDGRCLTEHMHHGPPGCDYRTVWRDSLSISRDVPDGEKYRGGGLVIDCTASGASPENLAYIVWAANNAPRLEAERDALREALSDVLAIATFPISPTNMFNAGRRVEAAARHALSLASQENTP